MDDYKHASASVGYKCADCTMDDEACPVCYAAGWQKKHPNTQMVNVGDTELNALRAQLTRAQWYADRFLQGIRMAVPAGADIELLAMISLEAMALGYEPVSDEPAKAAAVAARPRPY